MSKHAPLASRSPLIGSIPSMLGNPLTFMEQERKRLGDVFRLDLGLIEMTILGHPDHAQYVLRDHAKNYDKGGAIYDSLRLIGGDGLATTNNWDIWLRQRRMLQPQFHLRQLEHLSASMVEAVDEVLDDLVLRSKQESVFDLAIEFSRMTMNIIVRALFGSSMASNDAQLIAREASFAFDFVLQGTVVNKMPAWLPVPGRKRFNDSIKLIDGFIYKIIKERRETGLTDDLISLLMNMVDAETNEIMTDKQLRDEVVTMFLAGYETTAAALQWVTSYLLQLPDVLEKVETEIASLNGEFAFEDLGKLNYTQCVLEEVLRLRPPGFWSPRRAIGSDAIDGYDIPQGQLTVVMIHLIHRHPDFWEEPELFNPDRFLPENVAKRHHFAWMPFGAGQRQCIGRDFAIMEAKIILVRLLQRLRISPAEHPVSVQAKVSTTQKTGGVRVKLTSR